MDTLFEAADVYFAGERGLGLVAVVGGVVMLGVTVWTWRSGMGSYGTGLAVALLLLSLLLVGLGGAVTASVGGHEDALKTDLQADSTATLAKEKARVEAIATTFSRLKLAWMVLGSLAFILVGLAVGPPWLRGAALGVVVLCAVAMVIDTLGHRRTAVYIDALELAQSSR